MSLPPLTRVQEVALVLVRTLIGWHFLYVAAFEAIRKRERVLVPKSA